MAQRDDRTRRFRGITVVTCTKRPGNIDTILRNFKRQTVDPKELIVVLNNDALDIRMYQQRAEAYENVSVFQLSEDTSLGLCLNFAITKARYPYIAKLDDDDYYARDYLHESVMALRENKADVVGKHAHYLYLTGKKLLVIRFPKGEHRFVKSVSGATLVARKAVFNKVRFRDLWVGEDDRFCEDCRRKGFRIYSTSRYNFVGIRQKDTDTHTWKITARRLLSLPSVEIVARTKNYRRLVRWPEPDQAEQVDASPGNEAPSGQGEVDVRPGNELLSGQDEREVTDKYE
ncbi:glycosyltransferase [Alicyclobacillus pomorum]|jgi:glycosyltransferase involved in cell wall biosynthesis|uniref:glycosyltransferase n=1 Tax=Alicyclobacillus pomorum TaxID=204470 RepID=UPI0004107961|nr:glycosyltransferase [Alicyclobacillus pomorum]